MRYRKTRTDRDRAERILDQTFSALRSSPDSPSTPLAHLRTRLDARLADSRKETPMARVLQTLGAHPKLGVGLAAGLALILFGALVPLPYSSVIGYSVKITAPADAQLGPQQYADALHAAGVANPSVNTSYTDNATEYTVVGLASETEAETAVRTGQTLLGADADHTIVPIVKRTSGTLYAQAMEKLFRVEVTIDGKTDEQIAAEIAAQVAAQGGQVKEVRFERADDGQVKIDIEIDSAK